MSLRTEQSLESRYVMPTFGRSPVEFVSGRDMVLVDDAGKHYLDFLAGIGVCCLGHAPSVLVRALTAQAEKLLHVSNYFYIEGRGELAQTISNLLNGDATAGSDLVPDQEEICGRIDWQSFFTNSGAESNECAIKLARLFAKRRGESRSLIVTLEGSFHGRTLATLAATAQLQKQEVFAPLPAGFVSTPRNDEGALEELFATRGDEICAVIVECIQGESGVHPLTPDFLGAVREQTRRSGALMICDEVQTGIFRTGPAFCFQHFGVVPDIVTMAKGIGGGIPMGVCAARPEVAIAYHPGDHGTTFGGSPLAIAAARTVLSTLVDGDYARRVTEIGAFMAERLASLPHVAEVRGRGLMIGCGLDDAAPDAHEIVARGLDAGFVFNAPNATTLRFLPPLIVSESDIDRLVNALQALLCDGVSSASSSAPVPD